MILTSSPSMKPGLKVNLSVIFPVVLLRAMIDQEGKGEMLLSFEIFLPMKFDIINTCSSKNTADEAITILLKDSQHSTSISTLYITPASTINNTPHNNIKNSADKIIITGDLNAKHTDFHCTKTDKWVIALKTALHNADLFITENSKPTNKQQNEY